MKIIHTLKPPKGKEEGGKQHVIPTGEPNYSTVHEVYQDQVEHKGFLLEAPVGDDHEGKYAGHRFGLLFETGKDVDGLLDALLKLKARFDAEDLP